jgi:hypothetical protein
MATLLPYALPQPDKTGLIALNLPPGAKVLDVVLDLRPSKVLLPGPGAQPGFELAVIALVEVDQRAPSESVEFLVVQLGSDIPSGAEFVKTLAIPGQKTVGLYRLPLRGKE